MIKDNTAKSKNTGLIYNRQYRVATFMSFLPRVPKLQRALENAIDWLNFQPAT